MSVPPLHGRGISINPANRFIPIYREEGEEWRDPDDPAPQTRFFRDTTKSIFAKNESPDIPFELGINPYRGCEHGCVYCYARPTHEYLSLSCGLDFETQIFIKEDAPDLMRREFSKSSWKPQTISMSGVTDCYQPVELRLQITRRCLEVFAEFRNPVGIVTKNALVTRDIDLLKELAKYQAAVVFISVTTLDKELARVMEPRASAPEARLRAIEELAAAGIPVGTMVAPVIPGLTDHESPAILKAVKERGAITAAYQMLRLPYQVKELFITWLAQHFPERKLKVLNRILSVRDGKLNDWRFGHRMKGEGIWADLYRQQFLLHRERVGLEPYGPSLSTEHFRDPTRLF
ncbi:PA0069 family radical SAM protein [Telmatocola sphagniphila]|jgi:DNA repair photolyase|uniref:PA0069 family radical SAM protein n=1 Tax=Telmatocola sphagniphila TaxID=1123043 RepID=A0A8E6B863_9BACT|nr:PA0069 family radical SAM protein [Telmatocola sphagniphila]QVL33657.1 PA0069 family radical SAM protein [Telmatocola sphagniphila]